MDDLEPTEAPATDEKPIEVEVQETAEASTKTEDWAPVLAALRGAEQKLSAVSSRIDRKHYGKAAAELEAIDKLLLSVLQEFPKLQRRLFLVRIVEDIRYRLSLFSLGEESLHSKA